MIYNITSNMDTISDLPFFNDISIPQLTEKTTYEQYISSGAYTNAHDYFRTSTMHGYVADLINMAENRIYVLQQYLIGKTYINQMNTDSVIPTDALIGTNWIGGE